MNFSYYPGCTLKNKAQGPGSLRPPFRRKAGHSPGGAAGEWQCCGGVSIPWQRMKSPQNCPPCARSTAPRSRDRTLSPCAPPATTSSSRPTTPWRTTRKVSEHANNYMQLEKRLRARRASIHYLELLRDVGGL